MRLKIVSDGTAAGTSLVDAVTGAVVEGVVGATWSCRSDEYATAVIELECVEIDAVGSVDA